MFYLSPHARQLSEIPILQILSCKYTHLYYKTNIYTFIIKRISHCHFSSLNLWFIKCIIIILHISKIWLDNLFLYPPTHIRWFENITPDYVLYTNSMSPNAIYVNVLRAVEINKTSCFSPRTGSRKKSKLREEWKRTDLALTTERSLTQTTSPKTGATALHWAVPTATVLPVPIVLLQQCPRCRRKRMHHSAHLMARSTWACANTVSSSIITGAWNLAFSG